MEGDFHKQKPKVVIPLQEAALYRISARSLAFPDRSFTKDLRELLGTLGVQVLPDPLLPLGSFILELAQLECMPLDQIQGEYTRLFISGYPCVACPPYESVYREGEMCGEVTESIILEYSSWGLVCEEHVDHAGAELEFMAFLLSLGTAGSLGAAERFLREHLLQWIPDWTKDLILESRLGFYQQLGRLIACLVTPRDENSLTQEVLSD